MIRFIEQNVGVIGEFVKLDHLPRVNETVVLPKDPETAYDLARYVAYKVMHIKHEILENITVIEVCKTEWR